MPTKYLACDPNVGSDGNSGDSEKNPWLTLQVSIDKMVKARTKCVGRSAGRYILLLAVSTSKFGIGARGAKL